ncbi:MAG: hypothetical protein I3274_01685 [Candidatus Moeniiplasma glomeromycotorum]|nr:hypothetical protein [Candidatus Moeniiplasma glomeromycotorum]MCE8167330.1 hypothetical protein [Candidatus Moeniiplasma glomeromycotorum]
MLVKKLGIRIIFYSFFLLLLCLIPVIYKHFFMNYGIEMLLFLTSTYAFLELILIGGVVFSAEYYLFVKVLKVEIKDKWWRLRVSLGLVAFLFFISDLFVLLSG